ncbi:hypothetical protein V1503_05235 [Bacillus sp. SCS-151]
MVEAAYSCSAGYFQDKQTLINMEMMMIARGGYERSVGFYSNTSLIFLFD